MYFQHKLLGAILLQIPVQLSELTPAIPQFIIRIAVFYWNDVTFIPIPVIVSAT